MKHMALLACLLATVLACDGEPGRRTRDHGRAGRVHLGHGRHARGGGALHQDRPGQSAGELPAAPARGAIKAA